MASDFVHGGFQKSPNNPISWYPNPTIGLTADVKLTDQLRVNLGSFNSARPGQLSPWGWSSAGSMYNVIEFNRSYEIAGLTGDIKQGTWYESGSHSLPVGPGSVAGNYGAYLGWDQILFNEKQIAYPIINFIFSHKTSGGLPRYFTILRRRNFQFGTMRRRCSRAMGRCGLPGASPRRRSLRWSGK